MLKRFIKKHRENILVCMGALSAGIVSFTITLYFYPKIRNISINEEVSLSQSDQIYSKTFPDSGESQENILIIPVFENIEENESKVQEKNKEVFSENQEAMVEEKFEIKNIFDFDWPLSGDIIRNFATDYLVYSETLDEWCIHEGIDIAGNEGDVIVAVEDGIIEQIFEDEKYGKTIVVSHENLYKSYYSFVASENLVRPNQKVRKGEAIGRLIQSTNFESKDATHLHFEMLKNGIKISPIVEIAKK